MKAKAKDHLGERFGELRVTERMGSSPRGLALWLCVCDCGGKVVRRGIDLRKGRRFGYVSACDNCHRELRSGLNGLRYARQWEKTRSLWSERQERRLTDGVRADLEREFGPIEPMPIRLGDATIDPLWPYLNPNGERARRARKVFERYVSESRENAAAPAPAYARPIGAIDRARRALGIELHYTAGSADDDGLYRADRDALMKEMRSAAERMATAK